jgi:hypothetical protein
LHGARIKLLSATLDLNAPSLLDALLNLNVEAIDQRAARAK